MPVKKVPVYYGTRFSTCDLSAVIEALPETKPVEFLNEELHQYQGSNEFLARESLELRAGQHLGMPLVTD